MVPKTYICLPSQGLLWWPNKMKTIWFNLIVCFSVFQLTELWQRQILFLLTILKLWILDITNLPRFKMTLWKMELANHISWNLTLYKDRAETHAISQKNPDKIKFLWRIPQLEINEFGEAELKGGVLELDCCFLLLRKIFITNSAATLWPASSCIFPQQTP